MTKELAIWYRHPRTTNILKAVNETSDYRQEATLTLKTIYKSERLKIPMSARTHPEGYKRLADTMSKLEIRIAFALIRGLHSASQKNVVKVSLQSLGAEVGCSKPTLIKGLTALEENKFISRSGKQAFYILPTLAWLGSEHSWALALAGESEGDFLEVPEEEILKNLQ